MTAKRQKRRYREARRLGVVRDRAEFDELTAAGERPLRLATVDTTNSVYAAMVEARDAGDNDLAASLELRWLDLCRVAAGSLANSLANSHAAPTDTDVTEQVQPESWASACEIAAQLLAPTRPVEPARPTPRGQPG